MGEDKSLLPFGNCDSLVEYQYKKLSKLFQKVYISSKTNKFNFKHNLILDNEENISSPMIALQSIFNSLDNKKVFIITVDTPLILDETINTLIKQSPNHDIIIATDKDRDHNLCGVFDKNILPIITDLISKKIHKINHLIREVNDAKKVAFNNKEQFINLNTYNDYKQALFISKTNISY